MAFSDAEHEQQQFNEVLSSIMLKTVGELTGGTLYLVAVPIGNVADITLRALAVLANCDYIACEDTRNTALLLSYYGIKRPLFSLHSYNEQARIPYLLQLLQHKAKVALVSDAGLPLVSDPGSMVAKEVTAEGYNLCVVPGANAALTALLGSSLNPTAFTFLGFLPRKGKERQAALQKIAAAGQTVIVHESPHRIASLLQELIDNYPAYNLGARPVCLARELTKRYENYTRTTVSELLNLVSAREPKGECVLVFAAADKAAGLPEETNGTDFRREEIRKYCQEHQLPDLATIKKAWCKAALDLKLGTNWEQDEELMTTAVYNYFTGMKIKLNAKDLCSRYNQYKQQDIYRLLLILKEIVEPNE